MPLDIELPLWTIRPNWRNGILERLSWLTDVLPSTFGQEQRRALRLSPRREFEISFNPIDSARSYFDLFLHRLGSTEFMLPLFHDMGRISAQINNGDLVIPVDTTYREFEVGGLAILLGDDPFTYGKLEVTAVAADSITVAAGGVLRTWERGSAVYPLRRSRLSMESRFAALSPRVGDATLEFTLNQANDIPDEGVWGALYQGYPVLTDKPNRREQIDVDYIRNAMTLDNDHGIPELLDDAGRAFTLQVTAHMMRGRAEHWAFRQFLYRLKGQRDPIWLPSYNRDMELSRVGLAANAYIDIKKIGYDYTGGAVSGRHNVLIDGAITRGITDVGVALALDEERLLLSAALGTNKDAGTFASFMEPCRLSNDTVEIVHHTDTNGAAECNLSWKAFRDGRTTDGALDSVIAPASFRSAPCGEVEVSPDAAICVVIDRSSVMNSGGRMAWARQGAAGYLEGLRSFIAGGAIIDIQVRTMYSTTTALTKRAATEADLDALIAWTLSIGTGSTIIGDWRPAANGAKAFFNGTDESLTNRRLYWVGRGQAAWRFMGTGGAATINSIAPPPSVGCFVYSGGGIIDALLIDDTPSDGIPEFLTSQVAELTAAMLAI